MTEKERMLAGELFWGSDPELRGMRIRVRELTARYNATDDTKSQLRAELLRQILGHMGTHVFIKPIFRCDYGCNIHIGNNFYANFDCIILDSCPVQIGDNVMFGPRVSVITAIDPSVRVDRRRLLAYGKSVTIGNRVWVGSGAILCPGVRVGDDVVIGAGAVVTHDIPAGTIAAGNPCRVLRELTAEDSKYWLQKQAAYYAALSDKA